jgi:hypothetical protein
MKRLNNLHNAFVLILVLISSFLKGQILVCTPETAFEQQHNFNSELIKAKNIKRITFDIMDKKDYQVPVDKDLVETYEFNEDGKLIRYYFTNVVKTIEKQVIGYTGKKKTPYTHSYNDYLYDTVSTCYLYSNGQLVCKRYHDGAMYYESRYYHYDNTSHISKEFRFRETNNCKDKSVFILGGQLLLSEDSFQYLKYSDKQLKCVLLNNENRPYKEQTINYDEKQRITSVNEYYTAAAWIKQEQRFEYSNDRLVLAEFKGNANTNVSLKITYEYDSNNELLTEKHYKNDVLQKELSYITDNENKLLKSLVIRDHQNKSMRIIKLRYDFGSVSKVRN